MIKERYRWLKNNRKKNSRLYLSIYVFSQILHYSWVGWGAAILTIILNINFLLAEIIVFPIYAIIVLLFRGCPFSYLDDYIMTKAGYQESSFYSFKKSIFYKLFIKRFVDAKQAVS